MSDFFSTLIAVLLKNFTITFFVIGVMIAVISIVARRPGLHGAYAVLLNWFLLLAIGITYIFNGIMHTVFGDMTAASIGWENNGFQAEVGFASIGMGLVGVLAAPGRAPLSLKFAAILAPACFLWGAAGAHIVSMIKDGNFAPNNAGVILYTDIFIPVIGFALWGLMVATRPRPRAGLVEPAARLV